MTEQERLRQIHEDIKALSAKIDEYTEKNITNRNDIRWLKSTVSEGRTRLDAGNTTCIRLR